MMAAERSTEARRGSMALSIKRLTAPAHRLAEAAVESVGPMTSRDAYARYLARLVPFYAAIEPVLQERLCGAVPNMPQRIKRHHIEADLRFLGREALLREARSLVPRLPRMASVASALGVAYVLEGKTLGARFLLEQARGALELDAGRGATFFAGYEVATGTMWRTFREVLEAFVAAHGQRTQVLLGAHATFECFTEWIGATPPG